MKGRLCDSMGWPCVPFLVSQPAKTFGVDTGTATDLRNFDRRLRAML